MIQEEQEQGILRDPDGVPVEWTILHRGRNELMQDGRAQVLTVTDSDLSEIMRYYGEKGERIPVDSRHYLFYLAEKKGLEESEVAAMIPDGAAAMGFGSLHLSDGNLRIRVTWNPAARELLKDKIFRYFSPVIRGMTHPPLRVTSVALENEPAFNDLDELAASAMRFSCNSPKQKGRKPGKEPVMQLATETNEKTQEPAVSLFERLKELLGADTQNLTEEELFNRLKELLSNAQSADLLRQELARRTEEIEILLKDGEARKKDKMIEEGLTSGKLTRNLADNWAKKQDCKALAAYLEHAPVIVPVSRLTEEFSRTGDSAGSLTDQDRQVMKRFGFSETEFLCAKQQ